MKKIISVLKIIIKKRLILLLSFCLILQIEFNACSNDLSESDQIHYSDEELINQQLTRLGKRATDHSLTTIIVTTSSFIDIEIGHGLYDVIVDWGDSIIQTNIFSHIYTDNESAHAITLHCHPNAINFMSFDDPGIIYIDIAENYGLFDFYCYGTRINLLDVSNNPYLRELLLFENKLSTLDLSWNLELSSLYIYGNYIDYLDLSQNKYIENLDINGNPITNLDLSSQDLLQFFDCSNTYLSLIYRSIVFNRLSSVDITNTPLATNVNNVGNLISFLNTFPDRTGLSSGILTMGLGSVNYFYAVTALTNKNWIIN